MKNTIKYFFAAAALGVVSAHAGDNNCNSVASSVSSRVSADKSEVLKVVSEEIEKNPDCACEIVKAAIVSSKANKNTVGQIVEAAGNAAPDRIDHIVQCATSAAPDAAANIQNAAAKFQDAKGSIPGGSTNGEPLTDDSGNPLNLPGEGDNSPSPGGPDGLGSPGGSDDLGAGNGGFFGLPGGVNTGPAPTTNPNPRPRQ